MIRTLALASCLALPAAAQAPLSVEDFEAFVTGKTIHFRQDGARAGSEQYLEGRRVIWQVPTGECDAGRYYGASGSICFVYDFDPESPQCWTFALSEGVLAGQYDPEPEDPPLIGSRVTQIPLSCVGPDLGV